MMPQALIQRTCRMLREFACAQRGVAAVEFAMLVPFMLLLYLGTLEISQGVAVQRMVGLSASTVANLVTQYTSISSSQTMPDILNASAAVLTPFPVAHAVVTVSCITVDSKGNATVAWSQTLNGAPRAVGQVINLPAALDTPNTSLVLGETSYAYTPIIDFMHIGTINLYSSIYMLPRSLGTITLTS